MTLFRRPPAWLLVLVGLLLNVLALLTTSVVLEDYSQLNSEYQESKESNQHQIELAWSRVENLERKREALIAYISVRKVMSHEDTSILEQDIRNQLEAWAGEPIPSLISANLPKIFSIIETAQQVQRNRIDELYLNNLELTDNMSAIHKESAQYNNLALFLQVFGLALILARDLARKPS